jgi:hypothetical protein
MKALNTGVLTGARPGSLMVDMATTLGEQAAPTAFFFFIFSWKTSGRKGIFHCIKSGHDLLEGVSR